MFLMLSSKWEKIDLGDLFFSVKYDKNILEPGFCVIFLINSNSRKKSGYDFKQIFNVQEI